MENEIFDKLSSELFWKLLIDVFSVTLLVRFVYYRIYQKKDFFFTFYLFNVVIFMLASLLNRAELSIGAGFGLFAVFSLLRYRTENISEKDMTYLFIAIAMGLITSVGRSTYVESIIINFIIIGVAFVLDGNLFMKNEKVKVIQYEKIENIRPENYGLLLEDLRERTGLDIHKITIEQIDFVRDFVALKVYYY